MSIFGGNTGMTYEQLQRKRAIAERLMAANAARPPRSVGQGLSAIGNALLARSLGKKADAREKELRDEFSTQYGALLSGFGGGGVPSAMPAAELPPFRAESPDAGDPRRGAFPTGQTQVEVNDPWAGAKDVQAGIFAGESGGDYDALYGYSNRQGARFGGVKPTEMTVGQVAQFTQPSGEYGQWVKGQVGRVATPVGAYQIVGSTLRDAIESGVVSPDEKFTPAVQDRIGKWIYQTQGTGAWVGYRGPQSGGRGAPAGQPQGNMQTVMQLAALANNPVATPGERAVISALLQKQMQQMDPMRALELERAQLEIERLRNPQPDPTTAQRDYQLAVEQGFQGTFLDYQTALAEARRTQNNVNVNTGDPSRGKPLGTEGDVLVPDPSVPGGYRVVQAAGSEAERREREAADEAALEAEKRASQEETRQTQAARAGGVVLQDIQRVTKKIEESPWYSPVAGAGGALLSKIPGTNAYDVGALLRTIGGNVGFDRLQQMRDASPTGGALGAINQQELNLLMSVMGSLEQSQSEPQLLENLDRLNGIYTEIMKKAAAYPNAAEFGFGQSDAAQPAGQEPDSDGWVTLPNGIRVREKQ